MNGSTILSFSSAAAIAPHGDDELLAAGGSLLRLQAGGTRIYPVLVAADDMPRPDGVMVTADQRIDEFCEAAEYYTHEEPLVLLKGKGADARLDSHLLAVISGIGTMLEKVKPQLVLAPWPSTHQDHQTVARAVAAALRPSALWHPPVVWLYDYPSYRAADITKPFEPNLWVNIGRFMERKAAMWDNVYQSQSGQDTRRFYSVEYMRTVAKWHGMAAGCDYAEPFHVARWSV